jgi:hypothetical protein
VTFQPIAADPAWLSVIASDTEDDAWNELQDRLDRDAEYAPSSSPRADHAHVMPPNAASPTPAARPLSLNPAGAPIPFQWAARPGSIRTGRDTHEPRSGS